MGILSIAGGEGQGVFEEVQWQDHMVGLFMEMK